MGNQRDGCADCERSYGPGTCPSSCDCSYCHGREARKRRPMRVLAVVTAPNPRPVLQAEAVYFGDNGRAICVRCAGASARFTGRDLSGHRVERATVADVWEWHKALGRSLSCEEGCTTLSAVAGPGGWPIGTLRDLA